MKPDPEHQLTFKQKAQMTLQAAVMFARNPKALVALAKYKVAERKQGKGPA